MQNARIALVVLLTLAAAGAACGKKEPVVPAPPPQPDAGAPEPPPEPVFDAGVAPRIRRDAVTEQRFGITIADPYRWLERDDDPEVLAFTKARDEKARAAVADGEAGKTIFARAVELWQGWLQPAPRLLGKSEVRARGGVIEVVPPAQKPLVLVSKMPDGSRVGALYPSDTGRFLGYESLEGERRALVVLAAGAKKDPPSDTLSGLEATEVVWDEARGGLYYTYTPPDAAPAARAGERTIRFHKLGEAQDKDLVIVPPSKDASKGLGRNPKALSADGKSLLVALETGWERVKFGVVTLGKKDPPLAPVTATSGQVDKVFAHKGRFLQIVTAPDGSSEIMPLAATPGRPMKPYKLVAADHLITASSVGAYVAVALGRGSRVEYTFLDEGGAVVGQYTTAPGTQVDLVTAPDKKGVMAEKRGLVVPPMRAHVDVKTGKETVEASTTLKTFDPALFVVDAIEATSLDGAKVPVTVLRKKAARLDGTEPLWLWGYGGFRWSQHPGFTPLAVAWVERGGIYAIAHVRGGAELGEAWHVAGMRKGRPRVAEDFVAAATELHRRNHGAPARTLLHGRANGGLLASWVGVSHPALAAAVLAETPFTDMVRFAELGRQNVGEYGDPSVEEELKALHAMSPYHHVARGKSPAFFVTTSPRDERNPPLHARKLAAALEEADADVLLKVHGPKDDPNRSIAEGLGWALDRFARGEGAAARPEPAGAKGEGEGRAKGGDAPMKVK